MAAFRAGIRGYVAKSQAAEELVTAVRDVAAGGLYLSPRLGAATVDTSVSAGEAAADRLGYRDRWVLQLIAEGNTTKEIAAVLSVAAKTAGKYRDQLMDKLDIHDRAGLVRYAVRRGLIQPAIAAWAILNRVVDGGL